jgi:hypothetical protein
VLVVVVVVVTVVVVSVVVAAPAVAASSQPSAKSRSATTHLRGRTIRYETTSGGSRLQPPPKRHPSALPTSLP